MIAVWDLSTKKTIQEVGFGAGLAFEISADARKLIGASSSGRPMLGEPQRAEVRELFTGRELLRTDDCLTQAAIALPSNEHPAGVLAMTGVRGEGGYPPMYAAVRDIATGEELISVECGMYGSAGLPFRQTGDALPSATSQVK